MKTTRLFASLMAVSILGAGSTHAADGTWTGASTENDFWTNGDNWDEGTIPGVVWDPEAEEWNYDRFVFNRNPEADQRTITLDESYQFGQLIFQTTGAINGPYTLNAVAGKAIHLAGPADPGAGGYTIDLGQAGKDMVLDTIINAPLVFEAPGPDQDGVFNTYIRSNVTFAGAISGGATSGSLRLNLGGSTAGIATISGKISDGGAEGGLSLNLTRTWTITGDNDFTGGATLNANIILGHDNGLGSGVVTIESGGFTDSGARTIGNELILGTSLTGYGNGITFTGNATLREGEDPFLFAALAGVINFEGIISEEEGVSRGIKKSGNTTLRLTRVNTFSGGVVLDRGNLQLENNAALGSGRISIVSSNAGYTRGFGTSVVTLANEVDVLADFRIEASSNIRFLGDVTLGGDGTVRTLYMHSSTAIFEGDISEGETPMGINLTGYGRRLDLMGDNTFSGGLTFGGTGNSSLGLGSETALGSGRLVIDPSDGGFALINRSGTGALKLTTDNEQTWNGDIAAGATGFVDALHMGYGEVTLGRNIEIEVLTGMEFGVGGSITDGGGDDVFGLIKQGSGTLTLEGDNTFRGDITLWIGTLAINHAGALGAGDLIINSNHVNRIIRIDNTSGAAVTNSRATDQAWNFHFEFVGTNDLDLGTGNVHLGDREEGVGYNTARIVTVSNGKLTVGGVISDGTNGYTTSLTKTGAGELVLGGNNTLTGNLNVNAGTLTLNGSNADVSGVILSAGRLNINHAAALGSNGLTLSGSGDKVIGNTSGGAITATLSSSNNWSRGFRYEGPQNMTLQGGSIAFSWTAGTTQAIDVAAGTLTIRSGITGASNRHFEKTGAGTLIFNAAFGEYIEYEGSTTVSEGKLQINSANSFAGSGAVRIGGAGTFEVQINGGNASLENPVTVTGSGGTYRLLRANGTSYGDFALQSAIESGQNTTVTIEGFSAGGFMEGRFALDTVAPTGPGQRMSDVFSLSGTADTVFILQLQIAPLTEDGEELYLGWNRAGQWVNAILGNSLIGEGAGHFETGWQVAGIEATEFYLGAWGYDVASGSVWAVLDHNSEFAVMVVPEPGTYAMLGIGAALLACRRRRRQG